jgi:hypothetical protein
LNAGGGELTKDLEAMSSEQTVMTLAMIDRPLPFADVYGLVQFGVGKIGFKIVNSTPKIQKSLITLSESVSNILVTN